MAKLYLQADEESAINLSILDFKLSKYRIRLVALDL